MVKKTQYEILMKSIKTIIKQIIVENNIEDEVRLVRIDEVWKNKMSYYSDNIQIVKYKNKVLYLKTISPAWKQEIIIQLDSIIKQFNCYLEENLIEKIII